MSHFKLDINDRDVSFPKILRIYQRIDKNIFHWAKCNEPIANSAHAEQILDFPSLSEILQIVLTSKALILRKVLSI